MHMSVCLPHWFGKMTILETCTLLNYRNTVVILVFGCVFQNVEEEKQHDWYKQMYKSLHRNKKKEGKDKHVENNYSKLEDKCIH